MDRRTDPDPAFFYLALKSMLHLHPASLKLHYGLYHLSVETEENSLESSGGKLLLSWFLAVAVAATVMEV